MNRNLNNLTSKDVGLIYQIFRGNHEYTNKSFRTQLQELRTQFSQTTSTPTGYFEYNPPTSERFSIRSLEGDWIEIESLGREIRDSNSAEEELKSSLENLFSGDTFMSRIEGIFLR